MSFTEILEQLPKLTFKQRQELVATVMEIDELDLSSEVKAMINERWAEYEQSPGNSLSHEEFKARLQALRLQ